MGIEKPNLSGEKTIKKDSPEYIKDTNFDFQGIRPLGEGFGSLRMFEKHMSGTGTLMQALVVDPEGENQDVSLYYLNSENLSGDNFRPGKLDSEDVWNSPEIKHVSLPKVEKQKLFLVDNQTLQEPDKDFWNNFYNRIIANKEFVKKTENPTKEDLINSIKNEKFISDGGIGFSYGEIEFSEEKNGIRFQSTDKKVDIFFTFAELKERYQGYHFIETYKLKIEEQEKILNTYCQDLSELTINKDELISEFDSEKLETKYNEKVKKAIAGCKTLAVEPNAGAMDGKAKEIVGGTDIRLITSLSKRFDRGRGIDSHWTQRKFEESDFPLAVYDYESRKGTFIKKYQTFQDYKSNNTEEILL